MQLVIRSDSLKVLDVADGTTINELKRRVANELALPESEISLYCNSSPIEEENVVNELQSNVVEVLYGGLLGGKVHGSLARAGKVKGQTPKVEKQEKRKKKTGRAKRRIQYNRRFVNVVQGFGRRRGPNSNS
ncbi:UNVERIFIED_CONTAM: hypothetical protein PYX00_004091 [Menopon gallinae]|uniref:40S ribosomal protein S30 n=1 Tax=Menopon gallinae TaxID=328185 RepID=A0AAW2I3Z8_9NEOP